MTDATPSPFRRFPWVQLVFCVACLTMTAWTWMRYSYAWRVEAGDLAWVRPDDSRDVQPQPLRGYYVAVSGWHSDFTTIYNGRLWKPLCESQEPSGQRRSVLVQFPYVPDMAGPPLGTQVHYSGRVISIYMIGARRLLSCIDPDVNRLTGESVAGIVVGAMGCLIFGLYLRRWLRERKAAA